MIIKRILPYVLSVLILIGTVIAVSDHTAYTEYEKATSDEQDDEWDEEIRGLWVTYMTLDVEAEEDPEKAFCAKADSIIDDMVKDGFNTMFVQVRPFCDAVYRSAYFPWSHIITGKQGEDPGFDPLRCICERCSEHRIRVHAWVNPYRVSTAETPAALSDDHPVIQDPDLAVAINPASDKARELIVNGVIELLEQYDIDGIQFDDYFYPEDCGNFDSRDYAAYCSRTSSPLSLEDYRFKNVSTLIREVYRAVHQTDPGAVFGIAPQGNLNNNDSLFADVRKWCAEEGYIDYICPQIYFSLDNPSLTFENGLKDWLTLKKRKDLKLCIGLAGYKAGTDADSGTWLDNHDILQSEIEILRSAGCDGFILYSYDSLHNRENEEEIKNMIRYLTTSPTQNSSQAPVI